MFEALPQSKQQQYKKYLEKSQIMKNISNCCLPIIFDEVVDQFFESGKQDLITETIPALYSAITAGIPVMMLNFLEYHEQYKDIMKDDYKIQLMEGCIERLQIILNNWKAIKDLK